MLCCPAWPVVAGATERKTCWVCAVSSEWQGTGRRRRDRRRQEKTVGGQMVGEQRRCCTASRVLSVVPSPLPKCCVDKSGPGNICHFLHGLSADKFRLQACRSLLNVQQQHRPEETVGLAWQPELTGGPVDLFLLFCEVSEPVSSPSAAKPYVCGSAMCEKRQDVEGRRCPEPSSARLLAQQQVSGSGRTVSLLLHWLSSFCAL